MKPTVPFIDLKTENKQQLHEFTNAFTAVCKRGVFILGDQVAAFESEFAAYLSTKYAVGVASGTDALLLSLKALGVTEHDEVLIPANAYPTAFAVALSGTKIRLVDIDPVTFLIDPAKIEQAITRKTKVIVVVHLYGQAAQLSKIMQLAKKYRLFIIEDVAQAHGAMYKKKKLGTIGDIGCFSFYPTKNLGALGDGGMVVTKKKHLAENIRRLRNYGEKKRYNSIHLGWNSRLDEVQAALLRVKLKNLDSNNQKRRQLAKLYTQLLSHTSLILPQVPAANSHVFHLFVIRAKKRNLLKDYLEKHGVSSLIHYPLPIHLVSSFRYLGYKTGAFPEAERATKEILSLPLYPSLSQTCVKFICNLIKNHLQ